MRVVFAGLIVVGAILLTPTTSHACECMIRPVSERFRESKVIFVGRLAASDISESTVQNFGEDRYVFEVTRRFKGLSKDYVAIGFDMEQIQTGGMCVNLSHFEFDRDYLIFAYGKELTVQSVCTDSVRLKSGSPSRDELTQKELKKLDSFWFRTKARLWPF